MSGGDNAAARGPVADSRRGCCSYELDERAGDGWWTLCRPHAEASAALRAGWHRVQPAVRAGSPVFWHALAAVGVTDAAELFTDAELVARFYDAWEILT
jgi:hypothetical protein